MRRRRLLAAGCAHCAAWFGGGALAQAASAPGSDLPQRFERPDRSSDEGGLWALMDREETRLRRSPHLMRDAALRDYLQGIACRLGGDHCPDIRIYPVRTPLFNASMAPNGMMQVWSGLLLRMENEAQLAAVLGHEIGHYLQRHTLERLRDMKSRTAFMSFIGLFGAVGLIGQVGALAGAFGFSRDQERDADRLGLMLMRQAGYDPREAATVWNNLRDELAATPGAEPGAGSPMFATHPGTDERLQTLSGLAADANGGDLGEPVFAARLAPLQFALLEDELQRGRHAETLRLLDRLVRRAPQRADLRYFRAETKRLRAEGSDIDEALGELREAIALGNEPPQVHRSMGYLLQKQQQPEQARAAFGRYIELAPAAPDAGLIKSYL